MNGLRLRNMTNSELWKKYNELMERKGGKFYEQWLCARCGYMAKSVQDMLEHSIEEKLKELPDISLQSATGNFICTNCKNTWKANLSDLHPCPKCDREAFLEWHRNRYLKDKYIAPGVGSGHGIVKGKGRGGI